MQTRVISIAIINRTKDVIDTDAINSSLTGLPQLHARMGSMGIRYRYRLVDNWSKIDPNPSTSKNTTKEWTTNTQIGLAEIVMELTDEYLPTIRATGTPSPKPAIKVNVHIPPYLLDLIAKGMLSFVSNEDDMAMLRNNGIQVDPQFPTDSKQAALEKTDSLYNKTKDKATYLAMANKYTKLTEKLNITSERTGWETARLLRSTLRVDPGKIVDQHRWIARNFSRFATDDFQLVNLGKTNAFGRGVSELSKVGTGISVGLLAYKLGTDTWTGGSIIADGAIAMSGIIGAIFGSTALITILFWSVLAYGLYEVLTNGQLADFWDHCLPRDKPFAPPTFTHYVNRCIIGP